MQSTAQLFGGSDDKNLCPGMTAGELSLRINEWMSESFQVTVKFDPTEPIKHLERLEILSKKMEGEELPTVFQAIKCIYIIICVSPNQNV